MFGSSLPTPLWTDGVGAGLVKWRDEENLCRQMSPNVNPSSYHFLGEILYPQFRASVSTCVKSESHCGGNAPLCLRWVSGARKMLRRCHSSPRHHSARRVSAIPSPRLQMTQARSPFWTSMHSPPCRPVVHLTEHTFK